MELVNWAGVCGGFGGVSWLEQELVWGYIHVGEAFTGIFGGICCSVLG